MNPMMPLALSLILMDDMIRSAPILPLHFTTPPPVQTPTKFHPIIFPTPTPDGYNHSYDGPSKSDIFIAATDKLGSLWDELGKDIASDFEMVFRPWLHVTLPQEPPFTTPPPLQ